MKASITILLEDRAIYLQDNSDFDSILILPILIISILK